jgi:hypothetical protein
MGLMLQSIAVNLTLHLSPELVAKLTAAALQNGRRLLDEIEFRLERDFEHEAKGPRRSVRIRAKRRIVAGKRRRHIDGLAGMAR